MPSLDLISQHELVTGFYGYWPSFSNANVLAYERGENGSICFTLHTWQMTNQVDEKGRFVLRKHALVSFVFEGITACDMNSFRPGNILFEMRVEEFLAPPCLHVEFDSVLDMSGSFTADRGKIVSFVPCRKDGTPI
jgi:hypothetical protein